MKNNLKRIEELKHNEHLLYNLVDNLQVYFSDDERFINYLKKCGFNEEDIKKIVLLSDEEI